MKRILLLLIGVSTLSVAALAQAGEENNVAAAVEMLRKAMVDGDRARLEFIAAPELSYGHSGGGVDGKARFVEGIASGKSDFVKIQLSDQTIRIVNGAAIVRHTLTADTNDGGKPGQVHLSILLVFQKQRGEWKLLARQAVKLPLPTAAP